MFDWSEIRKQVMHTIATEAIPAVEAAAIKAVIQNAPKIKNKAQLALDHVMKRYGEITQGTPLGLTQIDDVLLRKLGQSALDQAWLEIDDAVKQAARRVGLELPAVP